MFQKFHLQETDPKEIIMDVINIKLQKCLLELHVIATNWMGASKCSIKGPLLNKLTAHLDAVLLHRH